MMPEVRTLHIQSQAAGVEEERRGRGFGNVERRVQEVAEPGLKRARSEPEEADPSVQRKKIRRETVGGRSSVPQLGVIEIAREDAYPLGLQAANQYQLKLIEEEGEEAVEKLELSIMKEKEKDIPGFKLKRAQETDVADIANEIDKKIGSQFFELYQILESKHYTRRPEGIAILALAKEIIAHIAPKEQVEGDGEEEGEVDEEYLQLAGEYLSRLPLDLPEEHIKNLARVMQKAVDKEEAGEDGDDEESTTERDNQVELAIRRIGFLLLASQIDIALTAECIVSGNFNESLNNISDFGTNVLEEAAQRIQRHTLEHARVAIQDKDEVAFQQLSKEMAEVLLLDSGSINFGIIEAVVEVLIPEDLKETTAVENQWLVLEELAGNPMLWELIARVNPPVSKEIPSDAAIRACFRLDNDHEITKRHSQLFVLSALLGHLRQAKAGTCFATACLIKGLYYHPQFFIQDLAELTEKGSVSRMLFAESRVFPMQAKVTKENLDVEIEVNQRGMILSTKPYDVIPDMAKEAARPDKGVFLYESPGVVSACRAMGISNVCEAVLRALDSLPQKFPMNELLKQLANYAFQRQEAVRHWFRSQPRLTVEEYLDKAQFAFGVETNHPLHRGYEQVAATMVNYFGAQYMMPSWVFETLEKVLKNTCKGYSVKFQNRYKKLLEELYLPMICRMRYRYNPNFDKMKTLFDDGNYGVKEGHWYGYQLSDTGLPKDFEYSTDLYHDIHSEGRKLSLERFKEYPPIQQWKTVETPEKFVEFLHSVITETVNHLLSVSKTSVERGEWKAVGIKMQKDISEVSFAKKMVLRLLGSGSGQKKEFNKNEYSMDSTPWQFAWGGDFDAILKTFFGFSSKPSKLKQFNGTPKEVLAKCINFLKKQPEGLKEEYTDPRNPILVSSPVHAFLLRPFEPTFRAAWESAVDTNNYITQHVEAPGVEVAYSRLNIRQRKEIIEFVANNRWVIRYFEKQDWVRQQLTEASKNILGQKLDETPNLLQLNVEEFEKKMVQLVIESRAADPQIGKRNIPWEQRFKRVFHNLVQRLVPNTADRQWVIQEPIARMLLDFARNREDSIALPDSAARRFVELANDIPFGATVKEFREAIVKAAYQVRCDYLAGTDPDWKESFCTHLDTKLFSVLSEKERDKLISSGIVTHDTNWKSKIHDVHFIFMVNPGTGKIEMVRYSPDNQQVEFMDQSSWFPRKLKGHGYWRFPDNYRAWKEGPLFNIKKLMGYS